MNKKYELVSELLLKANTINPNVDMLIQKPYLYQYITRDGVDFAKKKGIVGKDNQLQCYFTRIPETIEKYQLFLQDHIPVRIIVSKLSKVANQKIHTCPFNVEGYNNNTILKPDDVLKISKNNSYFFDYFTRGEELEQIPHAIIHMQKNILPAFCFKVLDETFEK